MSGEKFAELLKVNDRLLRPGDGCPWDLEQDHLSLRPYMMEEACEAIDAIDDGDPEKIKEELGDVLYQVIFHSKIAEKNGTFTIGDVCDSIKAKLIRRHPHIFHDTQVSDSKEVMVNWDKIKKAEKGDNTPESVLDGVPLSLPALQQAEKLQHKAAKIGFDWDSIEGPLDKVHEEIDELIQEIHTNPPSAERLEEELGDILFAVVNVARFCEVHPEIALRSANKKFTRRFKSIEQRILYDGKNIDDMNLEDLDKYWEAVKKEEPSK